MRRSWRSAPVNGILVGEATYRATRHTIEYREAEPVAAKGKTEPVPVWEAVAARSRFGVDVADQARTPLVGRERELGFLVDALARARSELAPQLVTLVGVPGIGKSRLVAELLQHVEDDPDLIAWRQGRSLPYGESLSYWALGEVVKAQAGILESDPTDVAEAKLHDSVVDHMADAAEADWVEGHLRPLVGLSGESETTGDRRSEAHAAWRRFLESVAEVNPLVVIFEDLHWADEGLLDFVDYLAEWAGGVPILIVGTARPELLDRRPGWGGGKRNAATVSISALSAEETAKLLAQLLEQALLPAEIQSRVLALAEGNPLYAEEYVRMLQDRGFLVHTEAGWRLEETGELPLPETVQGMIAARLDALPPQEKELLQDAAVLGKVFWRGALAAIGGGSRFALEEPLHALERKEFIRRERRSSVAGETQLAFLHLLVRDVAYGQIPRAKRVDKHRAAAEWIATLAADRSEDRAQMLAHHYVEALELARASGLDDSPLREPALAALTEASERAEALNAWPAALNLGRQALELTAEDDPQRPNLYVRLGVARWFAGAPAPDEFEQARRLFIGSGRLEDAARAEAWIAQSFWFLGDRERLEEIRALA